MSILLNRNLTPNELLFVDMAKGQHDRLLAEVQVEKEYAAEIAFNSLAAKCLAEDKAFHSLVASTRLEMGRKRSKIIETKLEREAAKLRGVRYQGRK
jgi:hypothetical protein